MTEDHEEAGYEFEKGKQKFKDERNAELEAERQIRADQNWSQVSRKCRKGFKRVILAGFIFSFFLLLLTIYVEYIARGMLVDVDWTDPKFLLDVAVVLFLLFMIFVVGPVLAFIGAMNMLSGCLLGISGD